MAARSDTFTARLVAATGMTTEETAEWLSVPKRSLDGYIRGSRSTPAEITERLVDMVVRVHEPAVIVDKLPAGAMARRQTIRECRSIRDGRS